MTGTERLLPPPSSLNNSMNKVLSMEGLRKLCELKRQHGHLIVLCHGCFDVLHLGHVRHLQAARWLGSLLVVTVTPDRHVNKGPGRPVFSELERAEMLAALECVDFAAVNEWADACPTITMLRPDVYAKGKEYRGKLTPALEQEKETVKTAGGRLVFTDAEDLCHTSDLLRLLEMVGGRWPGAD